MNNQTGSWQLNYKSITIELHQTKLSIEVPALHTLLSSKDAKDFGNQPNSPVEINFYDAVPKDFPWKGVFLVQKNFASKGSAPHTKKIRIFVPKYCTDQFSFGPIYVVDENTNLIGFHFSEKSVSINYDLKPSSKNSACLTEKIFQPDNIEYMKSIYLCAYIKWLSRHSRHLVFQASSPEHISYFKYIRKTFPVENVFIDFSHLKDVPATVTKTEARTKVARGAAATEAAREAKKYNFFTHSLPKETPIEIMDISAQAPGDFAPKHIRSQ